MARHASFEASSYYRPFFAGDAVPDAVAITAVGHDHVVAEDTFVLCPEGGDGALRLQVVVVRLETYPDRS